MALDLEYHPQMRYGTLVLTVVLVAFFSLSASAQANGVPPSVTSFGFGGQPGFHGTPPSVTSLGPSGTTPAHPVHPHPFQPQAGGQPGHHHHHDGDKQNYNSYYVPYYIPYYPAMDYEGAAAEDSANAQDPPDACEGGPTIFDRRGSGGRAVDDYAAEKPRVAAPRPPAPAVAFEDPSPAAQVPDPPPAQQSVIALQPTILIFKDGHKQQIGNYAIVGSSLYDLTAGRRQKVALADLDLVATQKANDDEGNDFRLPQLPDGN
jgi:hypothetical protein